MRIQDDRPGGAGGSPDDRSYGAHAQRPRGAKGAAKSTQSLGARQHNYYDEDDGYSAGEATSLVGGVGEDSGYAEELGKQRKPFAWNGEPTSVCWSCDWRWAGSSCCTARRSCSARSAVRARRASRRFSPAWASSRARRSRW
ncbi:hypothetical protein REH65_22385 [Saccharopolyspora sp. ID03-671]|uniref:hypothetical protein n=1 Tax=Saccharopolyspora sp. ID03-671 TaxID=3073066 RepID=UPI0032451A3E